MELGRISKPEEGAEKIRCTQVESLFLVQLAREVHVSKRRDCLDELVRRALEIGERAADADLSGFKGHPKTQPEPEPARVEEPQAESEPARAAGRKR